MSGTFSVDDLDETGAVSADVLEQMAAAEGVVEDDDEAGGSTVSAPIVKPAAKVTEEYKYGDDAPEELRGKTPAEAATLFAQTRDMARGLYGRLTQQVAATPAAPAIKQEDVDITSDDLLGTDPSSINRKLNLLFEQKAQPLVADIYQKQAANVYAVVKEHPTMPYFKKYEQEILAYAGQRTAQEMADPRNWKDIHDRIAASHMEEIIADRMRTAVSTANNGRQAAPLSERGTGVKPTGGKKITEQQAFFAKMLGASIEDAEKFI